MVKKHICAVSHILQKEYFKIQDVLTAGLKNKREGKTIVLAREDLIAVKNATVIRQLRRRRADLTIISRPWGVRSDLFGRSDPWPAD